MDGSDDRVVEEIKQALADQPLYIADGHHRYESALAYRRARRAGKASAGEEPFDFVMMALVDFADPGLVILPAHRSSAAWRLPCWIACPML